MAPPCAPYTAAPLCDLAERPPDRLDVLRLIRDIRILEIQPITDATRHPLPFVLIDPYLLFRLLVEAFTPTPRYLVSILSRALFPVAISTGRPWVSHPARRGTRIALHRLVAQDDILHDAADHVMDRRLAVRVRRPFIEHELLRAALSSRATAQKYDARPRMPALSLRPPEA